MATQAINMSDQRGRDAVVARVSVRPTQRVRYVDDAGRPVNGARLIRATVARETAALLSQPEIAGDLDKLSAAIAAGDPEVDLEQIGASLVEPQRVYIDPTGQIARKIKQVDVLRNPDGSERERRKHTPAVPNTIDTPVKWSGRQMSKSEVIRRFVLSQQYQIKHVNGLTFDFLYQMARELHESGQMVLVGSGPKGQQPLIFTRGGTAYRGFLEGRVDGQTYCLVLHLSNLELKRPPEIKDPTTSRSGQEAVSDVAATPAHGTEPPAAPPANEPAAPASPTAGEGGSEPPTQAKRKRSKAAATGDADLSAESPSTGKPRRKKPTKAESTPPDAAN